MARLFRLIYNCNVSCVHLSTRLFMCLSAHAYGVPCVYPTCLFVCLLFHASVCPCPCLDDPLSSSRRIVSMKRMAAFTTWRRRRRRREGSEPTVTVRPRQQGQQRPQLHHQSGKSIATPCHTLSLKPPSLSYFMHLGE